MIRSVQLMVPVQSASEEDDFDGAIFPVGGSAEGCNRLVQVKPHHGALAIGTFRKRDTLEDGCGVR